MPVSLTQADGLHLSALATLAQLNADSAAREFAAGLLATALAHIKNHRLTLAEALHHPGPEFEPLLAALLALDGEVAAVVDDDRRVFPLTGFISYRARLPLDRFPPADVRLPPLNPNGHYMLAVVGGGYLAVRTDLHPTLRVTGHVRLVLANGRGAPLRLLAVEQRLDRQVLTESLIAAALAAAGPTLSATVQRQIAHSLRQLI